MDSIKKCHSSFIKTRENIRAAITLFCSGSFMPSCLLRYHLQLTFFFFLRLDAFRFLICFTYIYACQPAITRTHFLPRKRSKLIIRSCRSKTLSYYMHVCEKIVEKILCEIDVNNYIIKLHYKKDYF